MDATRINAQATEPTDVALIDEQERKQAPVYSKSDLDGEAVVTLVEELLETERETPPATDGETCVGDELFDSLRHTKPALEGEQHRVMKQAIAVHQWLDRWICFLQKRGAPELGEQAEVFREQLRRVEDAMRGGLPTLQRALEAALVDVVLHWLSHGHTQTVEVSELLSIVVGRPIFISVLHQQELRVRADRDREKQQNRGHLRLAKRMVKRALA